MTRLTSDLSPAEWSALQELLVEQGLLSRAESGELVTTELGELYIASMIAEQQPDDPVIEFEVHR